MGRMPKETYLLPPIALNESAKKVLESFGRLESSERSYLVLKYLEKLIRAYPNFEH